MNWFKAGDAAVRPEQLRDQAERRQEGILREPLVEPSREGPHVRTVGGARLDILFRKCLPTPGM